MRKNFDGLNTDNIIITENAFDHYSNEPVFLKHKLHEGANKLRSQTV